MASKQLESIIATMPSATAKEDAINLSSIHRDIKRTKKRLTVKIVASATEDIKEELKKTAKDLGITESAIILRALKVTYNFQTIDEEMLVDRRTLR